MSRMWRRYGCFVGQWLQFQFDPSLGTSICRGCGPQKIKNKYLLKKNCTDVKNFLPTLDPLHPTKQNNRAPSYCIVKIVTINKNNYKALICKPFMWRNISQQLAGHPSQAHQSPPAFMPTSLGTWKVNSSDGSMDQLEGPSGGWVALPDGWRHPVQVSTAGDVQEGRAQTWPCLLILVGQGGPEERQAV